MGERPGQQWREHRGEPSSLHHRSRETRRLSTNHLAFLDIYFLVTDVASESSHTFTMPTLPHSCSWELDEQITLTMCPAAILTLSGHETTSRELFDTLLGAFLPHLRYQVPPVLEQARQDLALSMAADCNIHRMMHQALHLLTSV